MQQYWTHPVLTLIWTPFSLIPFHLGTSELRLRCSQHETQGKGINRKCVPSNILIGKVRKMKRLQKTARGSYTVWRASRCGPKTPIFLVYKYIYRVFWDSSNGRFSPRIAVSNMAQHNYRKRADRYSWLWLPCKNVQSRLRQCGHWPDFLTPSWEDTILKKIGIENVRKIQ
jgi:hypothetical protein